MERLEHGVDHGIIRDKVRVFAEQLLAEAKGDPIRALGLLVLVLDAPEVLSQDHAWRLVVEVRRVLMPEVVGDPPIPIRHLVGAVSWEGEQRCLCCGRVLIKQIHRPADSLPAGHIFEIGSRLTSELCEQYRLCS